MIRRPQSLSPYLLLYAGVLLLVALASFGTQRDDGAPAHAASSGGFAGETVYDNIPQPIDFAFAPDGRVFVATLGGAVRIIEGGVLLGTPFYTVPANSNGERGLVGLAFDPNFATNHYVYLFYTRETNAADPQGPKVGRLIRVTANGNVAQAGSELVLLGSVVTTPATPSCDFFPITADCLPANGLSHTGGGLRFAPDGSLFVATGDAAFLAADPVVMMTRVQNIDGLSGKLLRINPANGQGLPDNPFYTGNASDNRSKVYAYGFRQPFRFSIRPGTSMPFVGEVGSDLWEEIDVAQAGGNYGWPCYEGYSQNPAQLNLSICQSMYASQTPVEHPAYAYARVGLYSAAVIGGTFAGGSNYPADLSGSYFFADYVKDEIYSLRFDAANDPITESFQTVLTSAGYPVDFEVGADGDVYYLTWPRNTNIDSGEIRRLRYQEGNRAPVAQASAAPIGGLTDLDVTFSSAGTMDPDGDDLAYSWTFGDGGVSTEENPSHTYTTNGTWTATLTVSDGLDGVDSDSVTIVGGNEPPTAAIALPYTAHAYDAWDVLTFWGYSHDPETGYQAPAALHWSIGLRHCAPVLNGSCHTHPFLEMMGTAGTLIAPDQGDELHFLVFDLTVTDPAGLSTTTEVQVGPDSDGDGLFDFEEALTVGTDRFVADTDGGGAPDGLDYALGDPFDPSDDAAIMAGDADGDGCTNGNEAGANETIGGQRNALNHWDFFDVWMRRFDNPAQWERNGSIDLFGDIFGVAARFGTSRGSPPTEAQARAEADQPPVDDTSYHAAFDRGGLVGPNLWETGQPDGVISLDDVISVAYQFGHHCEPAPTN